MILRKLNASPQKRVPAAMALLCSGLMLVILNAMWTRIGWLNGARWSDFAHGFVIGLGITLEAGGLVLVMTAVKQRKKT